MLDENNTALLIVDVQGKLARMVYESEELIANIRKLIIACQAMSIPIVCLEQYPEGLGGTVPEIAKLLAPNKPLSKRTFNGLFDEKIEETIKKLNKEQWLICGIEAHVCVYQTALALLEKKYRVELVVDAISSRSKESIDLTVKKLHKKGIELTNVEMSVYELVKDSRKDVFKEILSLVKM